MLCQRGQYARNGQGDPRPHNDNGNPGQQCAVDGGKVGQLNLFKVVDAYRIGVPFPRKEDLHEIPHDRKLHRLFPPFEIEHGNSTVRGVVRLPAGNEERIEDALRHVGKREMLECSASVPAGITILEPTRDDLGQPRSRDNAQLTDPGNRLGKAPVRDPGTHAALNDFL